MNGIFIPKYLSIHFRELLFDFYGGGDFLKKKIVRTGLCNKKIQDGSQEEKKQGPGLLKQRKGRTE